MVVEMKPQSRPYSNSFLRLPLKLYDATDYMSSLPFEKSFDLEGWRGWMSENWTLSVYASILYIIFIFGTKFWMRDRKPFRLTWLLTSWNLGLAAFSVCAFLRTVPEFMSVMMGPNGFHNSVCKWQRHNYATAFWSWMLLMSKVVELGDTVFVVLRKQNLLFLHWYHHITTFVSWWLMYQYYEPNQLWYVTMNSFVHSFMYTYYALKALGVRVPRNCAMAVTTIQLIQMVFGIAVNVYAIHLKWFQGSEAECDRSYFSLKVSLGIYVTYFLLFAQFFYGAYISKRTPTTKTIYTNGHAKVHTQNGHSNGNRKEE